MLLRTYYVLVGVWITLYIFFAIPFAWANTIVLTEGAIVEITGENFGSAPAEKSQICFSDTMCSSIGSLQQIVSTWSPQRIRIQVPAIALPSAGTMMISVAPDGKNMQWVTGPNYTFVSSKPTITRISSNTVIAEETVLRIEGKGFGKEYLRTKTQVCVKGACLDDEMFVTQYLKSWSDTAIEMIIPMVGSEGQTDVTINIWKYTDTLMGGEVYFPVQTFLTVLYPVDPEIVSISPKEVTPEYTVMDVLGKGFGNTYEPGKHQICFGDSCLPDEVISEYLVYWSPTKIQIRIPSFVNDLTSVQLSLRLLFPRQNMYKHLTYPTAFAINPIPRITRYFTSMNSDTEYVVEGSHFGTMGGQVMIAGTSCTIVQWTDTSIRFRTPDAQLQGALVVKDTGGKASTGVSVLVSYIYKASKDTYSSYQWYLDVLGVPTAWKKTQGSEDIIVAVIDGGIDRTHPDVAHAVWKNTGEIPGNGRDDDANGYIDDVYGWDFVHNVPVAEQGSTHGTMVASIIAAEKDNRQGFTGIAPGVKVMSLAAMTADEGGRGDAIDVDASIAAITYAVQNGAKIINSSFGGPYTEVYTQILQYAYDNNVLVVSAAGNDGQLLGSASMSPICNNGSNNHVIGVGAMTQAGSLASFSNYGACVDMLLPGERIVVAGRVQDDPADPYSFADGTSFATPIYAGLAALLWSTHPEWNVAEIRAVLDTSAWELSAGDKGIYKVPNVVAALAAPKPNIPYTYAPGVKFVHTPSEKTILIKDPQTSPIVEQQGTSTGIFSDVPDSSTYAQAAAYLKEHKVIQGYADGSFRPENSINRAEFLKIILEGKGIHPSGSAFKNCFPDVGTQWFASYVCYAKEHGILIGYPDGYFRPEQTINRAESLKIFINTYAVLQKTESTFVDVPSGQWFTPFIATAEQLGILTEKPNTLFYPAREMTRGAMITVLYAFLTGR